MADYEHIFKRSHTYYVASSDHRHRYIGKWFQLDHPSAKLTIESIGCDYDSIMIGAASITNEQVRKLFLIQLSRAIEFAQTLPKFSSHPEDVQTAIISVIYGMGPEDFIKMGTLLKALDYGNYCDLTKAILESPWCIKAPFQADKDAMLVFRHCLKNPNFKAAVVK